MGFIGLFNRFLSFEACCYYCLISYLLQINAIISGEPLYLMHTTLPIALYEGVWKVQNYAAVAFLGLFTILQIGHFAEHPNSGVPNRPNEWNSSLSTTYR